MRKSKQGCGIGRSTTFSWCIQLLVSRAIWERGFGRSLLLSRNSKMKKKLRDALGNKSPQAVNKRVNSLLPFGDWRSKELFSWPLPIEGVLEFMLAERHGKKALSRGKALMAVRLVCAISQTRDSTFSIKECERTTIPKTSYDGHVASLL